MGDECARLTVVSFHTEQSTGPGPRRLIRPRHIATTLVLHLNCWPWYQFRRRCSIHFQFANLDNIVFEGPPKPVSGPKKSRRGPPSASRTPLPRVQIPEREQTDQDQGYRDNDAGDSNLVDSEQPSFNNLFNFANNDNDDATGPNDTFSPQEQDEGDRQSDTRVGSVPGRKSENAPSESLPTSNPLDQDDYHGKLARATSFDLHVTEILQGVRPYA